MYAKNEVSGSKNEEKTICGLYPPLKDVLLTFVCIGLYPPLKGRLHPTNLKDVLKYNIFVNSIS